MNRKKGFSLIELLAVVIILAVLALILIPFIGNLIKEAKINSAVVSAYGYVEAANNEIISKQTKGENVSETTYNIEESSIVGDLLNIKYEGKGPSNGWFNISRSKVTDGEFCINGYDIKYEDGKATYIQDGEICPGAPLPELNNLCEGSKDPEVDKEYAIRYVEDLVCLSQKVNSGKNFANVTVILEKDIDFNNNNSYKSGTVDTSLTSGSGFTPIGNSSNTFNGIFKSSNFNTISNLYITRNSSSYIGLFGNIGNGAVVGEFNINTANISGSSNVGGVAGYATNAIIKDINLYNVTISNHPDNAGGIVGYSNNSTIKEVTFRGKIVGGRSTGGAVGKPSGGSIDGVLVKSVTSGSYNAGGMIGKYEGTTPTIKGVIEGGSVNTSAASGSAGLAAGSSYNGIIYVASRVSRTTTAGSYNGNTYDFSKHYVSMYDDVLDTIYGGDSDGSGYYFDYDENDNYVVKKVDSNSFKTNIRGNGTESNPYILSTERDFRDATILNNGNYYFKLGNNIDVSTFTHFYPLGTITSFFNGYLDGDGKIISNMNINGGQYTGFISFQNGGSISNLGITDSVVNNRYDDNGATGILAGEINNASITNLKDFSNITVTGKRYTAGIVGILRSNMTLGGFNLNTATISSSKTVVGGIVGHIQNSTIKDINMNNVTINDNAEKCGGVAGYSYYSTIKEIMFRGSISGGRSTGGIVGLIDKSIITDVLVNASITGTYNVGGIIGKYEGTISTIKGVVEGGSVNTSAASGTADLAAGSDYEGLIYVASRVQRTTTAGSRDGNPYDFSKHYVSMYDDVLDTIYGGDSDGSGYYFDYDENDVYVLKKVNANSFDTTISGSGTSSDPYILSTESDFRDATVLNNGNYYFKLGNNIDVSTFTHFYPLGTIASFFNGHLDGNGKIISNMNINGGQYTGFISFQNGGSISNLGITDSVVNNRYNTSGATGILAGEINNSSITNLKDFTNITVIGKNYTAGIVGILRSNMTLGEFNITNATISGRNNCLGGVVGHIEGSTIRDINLKNITINEYNSENVGGVAGFEHYSTIKEVTFRGTIRGGRYTGGIVGRISNSTLTNVLIDATVSGSYNVGGIIGKKNDNTSTIYGIVEGGSVNTTAASGSAGKAAGESFNGAIYVSSSVTRTTQTNSIDGTSYSSDYIGDLNYYGSIKYNTNQPLLDSSYTGDVNNTGWWFTNDSNGDIVVVRVGSTTPTPNPPTCENCTNSSTYPLENATVTGICLEEDITPPTCTFNYFVAVTNGIRASFSCTDDTSVPTVASMFNSTTKAIYTFAEITDQSRGGTVKTGTVSGNTRNITSTWTTQTVPSNPPTRGTCYYYQMAAIDSCGNEGDYTTSYCYYGFSNN